VRTLYGESTGESAYGELAHMANDYGKSAYGELANGKLHIPMQNTSHIFSEIVLKYWILMIGRFLLLSLL